LSSDVHKMDFWWGGRRGLLRRGGDGLLLWGGLNSDKKRPKKKQRERDYFRGGADGHLALTGIRRNFVSAMEQESLHGARPLM
jgi:hypothetical protein